MESRRLSAEVVFLVFQPSLRFMLCNGRTLLITLELVLVTRSFPATTPTLKLVLGHIKWKPKQTYQIGSLMRLVKTVESWYAHIKAWQDFGRPYFTVH